MTNIHPGRQKLIIYSFLIVATLAVYVQVYQFDFINLDDSVFVTKNIHIQSGISLEDIRWAFGTTHVNDFWYPLTLFAGLSTLRPERGRVSSDESHSAHAKRVVAFLAFSPHDGSRLEERFCRGLLRPASFAGGIGRLDCRTQGFIEWIFLDAYFVLVRQVHGKTRDKKISARSFLFRPGSAQQTHDCDPACGHDSSGLLAPETI
jgi:hypothetical protein